MTHDITLANSSSEEENRLADLKFYQQNVGKGIKRSVAAYAVRYLNPIMTRKRSNLRGSVRTGASKQNDSKLAAPVAIATRRTGATPKMTTKTPGVIEVSHRSFLAPIASNATYTTQRFYANPGMPGTFPWLSRLARRYEMYRFKRLRFEYRSVCATDVRGVVMMSFDYDAADDLPSSKAQQAQTIPNSEINSWASNDLSIPTDGQWRYVRAGALSSNLDIKTYDFGQMVLSSIYGDNTITGELYVDYTVEFCKPTDGPSTGGTIDCTPTLFTSPFTTPVITGPVPFEVVDANTLRVLVPGEYLFSVTTIGTGLSSAAQAIVLVANGTGAISSMTGTPLATTSSIRVYRLRVDIGDQLTLTNAGTGTTITRFTMRIGVADYNSLVV